jgi:hypothetical protein
MDFFPSILDGAHTLGCVLICDGDKAPTCLRAFYKLQRSKPVSLGAEAVLREYVLELVLSDV